ncbi:hypothetical protein [Arthrobacter celericrescens]|uniref:hypothetical protein n=1 Tax=Arthrobacter celericrescens TaxID=2320851 RepID=UPI0013C4E312|nr:hypothetical protein [Arthrobacter celericrescens]
MAFDVFFQGFVAGHELPGGGDRMRDVLQPFIVREEADHGSALFKYGDGSADVYLGDDGMMANHITGEDPWGLLVEGARAAGWVIMPIGCRTCITDESQRVELPEGFDADAVVVTSGRDLLSVVESS